MEATEKKTTPHVVARVDVRGLEVVIPVEQVEEEYGAIGKLRSWDQEEAVKGGLRDALERELFNAGPEVEIDEWEVEERTPVERVKLTKPKPGEFYTLPAPYLGTGDMRNLDTFDRVTTSSLDKLTDEQVRGAHAAVHGPVFQRLDLTRNGTEELARILSELEWIMLGRPSLHFFTKQAAEDGDVERCVYCNQPEQGHDTRDDDE